MTKPREPVTIENALMEVLGRLRVERAAEVTGRAPHYLQALTDPAKGDYVLNVVDLRTIDLAHRREFGGSFPLYEALGRMLESDAAEQFADQAAIGATTSVVAREAGQAVAALVAAMQPGATAATIETALREVSDLDGAADNAIPILRSALDRARAIERREQPP